VAIDFKIESGVPLPEPVSGRASYPFGSMNVGDSFFVAAAHDDLLARDRLASAASYFGIRNKMKFARRKVDGGFRVWRLA
jgi:hypothetical protein